MHNISPSQDHLTWETHKIAQCTHTNITETNFKDKHVKQFDNLYRPKMEQHRLIDFTVDFRLLLFLLLPPSLPPTWLSRHFLSLEEIRHLPFLFVSQQICQTVLYCTHANKPGQLSCMNGQTRENSHQNSNQSKVALEFMVTLTIRTEVKTVYRSINKTA